MVAGVAGGRGGARRPSGAKRVVRTGLALVHENEIVYPAAGSEAMAQQAVDDASADIEVHFPVTIEITMGDPGSMRETATEAARSEARRVASLLRRR
jgi:hypothetical protein